MEEEPYSYSVLIALVSSLLMLVLGPQIVDVVSVGKRLGRFLRTAASLLARDDDDNDPDTPAASGAGGALTCGDAAAVAARLGLGRWRCGEECGGGCGGRAAKGAVEELTEEKRASERELEEAFYVFDRDEDGVIRAAELWNVMRRLGFREGASLEDCATMIRAADEDGDGGVSFAEFRNMMENAL